MTVTSLFKTELLQDVEKKQDKIRKNWRWRLKWDENWCKRILMWWSTDETRINLSHIWVRSEQDVWRVRRDEMHFNMMMHRELKHIWITSESDLNKMSESDLNKIWVRFEQKKDKMQFNVMMYRQNWNTFKSHLNQI